MSAYTLPRTGATLAADAPDVRVVACDACRAEGRTADFYDGPMPCPVCEGTGGEVIEVQPVEMDDLPALVAEPAHHATAATVGADRESKGDRSLTDISARDRSPAGQLSDAVLAEVLNWDDALGLAYRISPHYANYTEVELLATVIWRRAQERHQLDKDERS